MKKLSIILILLLAYFFANAQNTITLFETANTADDTPFPWYTGTNCVTTQIVYPSSYLTDLRGKEITKITFYFAGANGRYSNAEVKLGTVSSWPNLTTGFTPLANETTVYTGSIANTSTSPYLVEINFTTNFKYNNEDNLVIDIRTLSGNTTTAMSGWTNGAYCTALSVTPMRSTYYSTNGCTGTINSQTSLRLPKITFEFVPVPKHTITPSAGSNGSISPSRAAEYDEGSSPVFKISPNTGYEIDKVMTDGNDVTSNVSTISNPPTYTFPTLAAGTTTHTIHVTFKPIVYNITYNDDYTVTNGNPLTYTIEETPMTLAPLSKDGYTFVGWYDNGGFSGNPVTQIAQNATGNKTFWARWIVNTYDIIYHDEYEITHNNPLTYTIEETPIVLNDPSEKNGYNFDGWYNSEEELVTEIEEGSTGNVELWAKWTVIIYEIAYENTKGVQHENRLTYTIEDTPFELEPLTKTGYTFKGWYDNDTLKGENIIEIEENTTGNLIFWAGWETNIYTIDYNNLEGAQNTNPPSYTVEDLPLTLSAPTPVEEKTFGGWYNNITCTGTPVTVIEVGTAENLEFWAKWGSGDNIASREIQNVHVYAYMNTVYIINETDISLKSVEIMDITGRIVYRSTSVQSPISLNVAEGQYMVRLMSHDGVLNTKVVIKK